MADDFSARGKSARARINVPELSMDAIRIRARRDAVQRFRAQIVIAAIGIAVLSAGAAVGEKVYNGVRVWLLGGKAAVNVSSLAMVREPMARDLRDVAARATFPVVFPVAVPDGSRVSMMLFSPPPPDRPNYIELHYANKKPHADFGFALVDTSIINKATLPSGSWKPSFVIGYQWQIGRETVLVSRNTPLTAVEIAHVEAAMARSSPTNSLKFIDRLLSRMMVLGANPKLADFLERYAPATSIVLLDPQLTPRIMELARRGEPVVDDRTIYLKNIPSVKGQPDFDKATLFWPRRVAVAPKGVQAIDAVLRFTDSSKNCACVILFSQPSQTSYLIWKVPLASPSRLQKFTVDSRTNIPVRL